MFFMHIWGHPFYFPWAVTPFYFFNFLIFCYSILKSEKKVTFIMHLKFSVHGTKHIHILLSPYNHQYIVK